MRIEQERALWTRAALCGLIVLCFHSSAAQYAKTSYFMDSATDCYIAGHLLIANDGVVNVNSRRPDSTSSKIPQCTLRFRPEDTRHIIDVTFTHFSISDPGVTLRVDVQKGGIHTLKAGDGKPPQLTSEGGLATISLTRTDPDANNYAFGIIVRVYKKDDGRPQDDDNPGPVGLIVGLVVGIIAFLIFLAILGVCCYRRKKERYLAHQHGRNFKGHDAEGTLSPSHSYGIDNTAHKEMFPPQQDMEADDDIGNYSPRLKQKLLLPSGKDFDYRDYSGSESDSKDPYVIGNYDRSPKKATSMKYEDENLRLRTESTRSREYNDSRQDSDQQQIQLSGSPKLNSRHANPLFRPERETLKMKTGNRDVDSESDVSTQGKLNKASTSIREECQPPEKTPRKLNLPSPASRSQSRMHEENTPRTTYTQQQNTTLKTEKSQSQNCTRNSQPYEVSSSSSETEPGKAGEDSPGEEKSPASVSQEKPDTRHVLRPDRTKKKKTPEKLKTSPESDRKEPAGPPDSKPPKLGKENSKTKKANKSKKKTGPKLDAPEYEGRFKKADSARKSKSKSPRIGRSRSTGNTVDDTDSIGGWSVSSAGGYRAVPSVTADDYEDSDRESHYNPLRRSSSKTSLYASRSSLYGRRRRKNSIGESVCSLAYDDFDGGSIRERSLSRRHRGFRSLGDLEVELRDQATRATQTLQETATQTRSRKNSISSTSGRSKSRERKNSTSSTSGRPKRAKSESELRKKAREAEEDTEFKKSGAAREKPSLKPKPRPKPKPRKSTTTEDKNSTESGAPMVAGLPALGGAQMPQPVVPVYAYQEYPGYIAGYPPQLPYLQATGQPPVATVPTAGATKFSPDAAVPISPLSGPPTAPKPSLAKWEMLCRITDAAKEREESVAGSVFSD